MSQKSNGVNHSLSSKKKDRRRRVINMLKEQLVKGTKVNKENKVVPLTEKNITRINKELEILKSRV